MTNWKAVAASIRGRAHEKSHLPCQDVHCISSSMGGARHLVVACADGAGSAPQAEVGAYLTTQAVAEKLVERRAEGSGFPCADRNDWLEVLDCVRARIGAASETMGVASSELASTMMAGMVGEDLASFAQLGDGAIVVEKQGELSVPIWPQHGMYANVTNFVTSSHAEDVLQNVLLEGHIEAVAVFTDGLERLVLDFKDQIVPGGFLEPLWGALRVSRDVEEFQKELADFLRDDRIRSRTDDDVTLLLAVRDQPED